MNVTGVVNKQLPVRIYEANEHDMVSDYAHHSSD